MATKPKYVHVLTASHSRRYRIRRKGVWTAWSEFRVIEPSVTVVSGDSVTVTQDLVLRGKGDKLKRGDTVQFEVRFDYGDPPTRSAVDESAAST